MPAGRAARPVVSRSSPCRRVYLFRVALGQTGCVPPGQRLSGPVRGRGDLIARIAAALVIEGGRRSGDPETRVGLDHRLPDPGRDDPSPRARWRLATSSARLYPPPVARKPLSVWHCADGAKSRRRLAGDLANDNRVRRCSRGTSSRTQAAGHIWSPRPPFARASIGRSRPSTSSRSGCSCASPRRSIAARSLAGASGLSAIDVDLATLKLLGFRRGRRADGYHGDYYVVET
jgi:hypothetical protein